MYKKSKVDHILMQGLLKVTDEGVTVLASQVTNGTRIRLDDRCAPFTYFKLINILILRCLFFLHK